MAGPGKEEVQKPYQGQCCGTKSGARGGWAPRHDFEAGFSCCLKSVGSIVLHERCFTSLREKQCRRKEWLMCLVNVSKDDDGCPGVTSLVIVEVETFREENEEKFKV